MRIPRARRVALAGLAMASMSWAAEARAQAQIAPPQSNAQQSPDATANGALPAAAPGQLPAGAVGGMGDVNLFPKRVVMSDRERTTSIGLYNRAAASGDYDITIADMMMTHEGRLVELASVADPAARARVMTASGMLRWSPHRVTLPASEAQMVRIMVRVPQGLPSGEYRAHFSAISVPPETGGLSIEEAAGGRASGVGVQIVPRFGISIPVIIRVGETTLTNGLRDMALVSQPGGGKAMTLRITREGTRSSFGDITITAPGAKKPIGEIKGIGVYTELAERTVQVPLDPKADPRFLAKGTKWTVTYTDDDFAPGKTLARQEFIVP